MRVPEACLVDLRERGYFVLEEFLARDEVAAARDGLWLHYPRPEVYFADPGAHAWLGTGQWAGVIRGPWRSWALTRLAFHPDLLDLAERFLGSSDLRLYEAELWAKYAGAVDYDVWAPRWTGRVAWAQHATDPEWFDLVERASPRERSLFGFPAPGDPFWDEQTLADTQVRYPGADLTPYR